MAGYTDGLSYYDHPMCEKIDHPAWLRALFLGFDFSLLQVDDIIEQTLDYPKMAS